MRIYTWLSFDLRTGGGVWHAEEYEGPVVYAGGGSEVTNETVPTGPFGPQIPYILGLFNEAARLYNQGPPQAFSGIDGQLTPDINPNIQNTQDAVGGLAGGNIDQSQLIQQILSGAVGGQNPGQEFGQSLTPGITGGLNDQLGGLANPLAQYATGLLPGAEGALNTVFNQNPSEVTASGTQGGQTDATTALAQQLAGGGGQNPYLDSLVQGAISSATDAFNRNVLPGIRSEAQAAGQIGGTRHGIAEGIAASDFNRDITDLTSNIYGNAFNTQAGLQGNAVGQVLSAQQGDQSAALNAAGLTNQAYQQYIQSLLQGAGTAGSQLGQGLDLGFGAVGTGTAQAGKSVPRRKSTGSPAIAGSRGIDSRIAGGQSGAAWCCESVGSAAIRTGSSELGCSGECILLQPELSVQSAVAISTVHNRTIRIDGWKLPRQSISRRARVWKWRRGARTRDSVRRNTSTRRVLTGT